jgi:6-phosphofructokinase 1
MPKFAVLTSGGDAPGMNAAIRAVVRGGIELGYHVVGVRRGYAGLVAGDWRELTARDVGGLLASGGTFLGSARLPEFESPRIRREAIDKLRSAGIEGLVVIGGNGSQAGAWALAQDGFPVVGVASTIDNDLPGADITIGVDTALNIALEAIDRLKNTASSHRRAFLVETMGRKCGYLALMAAIAGGAEGVVIPEQPMEPDDLAGVISDAYDRGKPHALIVVAEGSEYNAAALVAHFEANRDRLGFQLRATTLGHVQRGGNPTAFDRLLATRLGWCAANAMHQGQHGRLVALVHGEIQTTPLAEVCQAKKELDPELVRVARVMTR